jgi:hypothetical protein
MSVSIVSVKAGDKFYCKYPKHGNRNLLVNRDGFVESTGVGPAGEYVKLQMTNGMYRTLSTKRMVDVKIG